VALEQPPQHVETVLSWNTQGPQGVPGFGEVGKNAPTVYYAQNFTLKKRLAGRIPLDPAISIPINVIQTLQPPQSEQVFFECKATFGLNRPKFISSSPSRNCCSCIHRSTPSRSRRDPSVDPGESRR